MMFIFSLAYFIPYEKFPIMNCDPASLEKGMGKSDIIAKCGQPNQIEESSGAWYPFHGETRENYKKESMLIYGNIFSKNHNVNLYLNNGKLESIQIYGDYR